MKKPKLIAGWKKGWRLFSVQAMSLATAIQLSWLMIPEDMRTGIDGRLVTGLAVLILILGIVGRFIQQGK